MNAQQIESAAEPEALYVYSSSEYDDELGTAEDILSKYGSTISVLRALSELKTTTERRIAVVNKAHIFITKVSATQLCNLCRDRTTRATAIKRPAGMLGLLGYRCPKGHVYTTGDCQHEDVEEEGDGLVPDETE